MLAQTCFEMPISDRNKIEYAKRVLRRTYAVGAILSAGALVANKYYQVIHLDSRDDLSNVGLTNSRGLGPSDFDGTVFIATGTAPTTFANGTRLQQYDVAKLITDANAVYSGATKAVTLKSTSSEGGSQSGDITFERVLLGMAYEELIAELDPNYVLPSPVPRVPIGTTVRLGY